MEIVPEHRGNANASSQASLTYGDPPWGRACQAALLCDLKLVSQFLKLTYYRSMHREKPTESTVIQLAEKILTLLDQGSFVATYKYAVLLGLIDLCLEGTGKTGQAPHIVTTRQLAEKILELYWPHSMPYTRGGFRGVLKQNTGKQAKIISDIIGFREKLGDRSLNLFRAKNFNPTGFEQLIHKIEWTLILMPLPRVQFVGKELNPFLYSIGWDTQVGKQKNNVAQYQRNCDGPFDNRIHFKPGVGEALVQLNGLLRPLIYRQWSAMVAQINHMHESKLEEFLFGASRISLEPIRKGLLEIQDNRCFYCSGKIKRAAEVDHFIPWARHPDNAIENLVATHHQCNSAKRDFLAAADHVCHWSARLREQDGILRQLHELAQQKDWENHSEQSLGVARGIYLKLAPETMLWQEKDHFVPADPTALQNALRDH